MQGHYTSVSASRTAIKAILALALAVPTSTTRAAPDERVLEVLVDHKATGLVGEFRGSDSNVYALRALLQQLHFPLPRSEDAWVRLRDIDGLAVEILESTQQIDLSLAPAARALTRVDLGPPVLQPPQRLAPGMSVGYDINSQRYRGDTTTAAHVVGHAFGPYGVLTDDAVWRNGSWQRLETFWEMDFPDRLEQVRVGDTVSVGPNWSRAVRLGGVQWRSDMSMRPDLVTFPLPGFTGQAAVPSTLDLFVNGLRTNSTEIPTGPFTIPQLPILTNGGVAVVMLRDALGREQSYSLPFYISPNMLRADLNQFAIDVGRLRHGFAGSDDGYGTTIASASDRYGLTDNLTLEGHIEAASPLRLGGIGLVGHIDTIGAWNAAVVGSRGHDCTGFQGYLATEWQRGPISIHTLWQQRQRHFCDLATLAGQPPPRAIAQLGVGVATRAGDFNLMLLRRREADAAVDRIASANWSKRLMPRLWVSLGVLYNVRRGMRHDLEGQFSVVIPLSGGNTSFNVNGITGSNGTARARIQTAPPPGEGWGGYVDSAFDRHDVRGNVTYRSPIAEFDAEGENQPGGDALRVGLRGAVAWMDDKVFWTRQLGESFAVVETDGVANLPVYRENQLLGYSDEHGYYVVDQLRAFESNRIAFDPGSLPPDFEADATELQPRPYRGGGIVVAFPMRRSTAVPIQLLLTTGDPVPAGSVFTVDGVDRQTVGYDGLIFLPPPAPTSVIEVRGSLGRCRLARQPAASVPRADIVYRCEMAP